MLYFTLMFSSLLLYPCVYPGSPPICLNSKNPPPPKLLRIPQLSKVLWVLQTCTHPAFAKLIFGNVQLSTSISELILDPTESLMSDLWPDL